jgi:hypothetical protein
VSRIKGTKSSAALLVAVIALVAALGGGAVAGVTISKLNKKEKQQVKRISKRVSKKQARKLDRRIELMPGPQGEQGDKGDIGTQGPKGDPGAQGPKGDPGQDATNLFGYIRQPAGDPVVQYGEGVTDVSLGAGLAYLVTFNRSLVGCVVTATPGFGNPEGAPDISSYALGLAAQVALDRGSDNQAQIQLKQDSGPAFKDSFMVAAFC